MARAKKKAAKKKAGGRPSKYDGIDHAQVEKLAKRGWTDAEMADFFEVNEATWNRWKARHPEFCESLKGWKDEADEKVERSLYEKAVGYEQSGVKIFMPAGAEEPVYAPYQEKFAPDTTACIFWLKNRKKGEWRDRADLNLGGQSDNPLTALIQQVSGETLGPTQGASDEGD